ncbi:MAG: hypothetical protein HGA87_02920 [Desulfobulbaceae bacterium]|nr:hypothetical protein [Desulfobulbaceae bacterium]
MGTVHLGTFDFSGKSPGTYAPQACKLYGDYSKDLLDSADSFLLASRRCLNDCKVEPGVEMLLVPGIVCGAFSCELFLKYIIFRECGEYARGHNLADLYHGCSNQTVALIELQFPDIEQLLARNADQFVVTRYSHEAQLVSFRHGEIMQLAQALSKLAHETEFRQ